MFPSLLVRFKFITIIVILNPPQLLEYFTQQVLLSFFLRYVQKLAQKMKQIIYIYTWEASSWRTCSVVWAGGVSFVQENSSLAGVASESSEY